MSIINKTQGPIKASEISKVNSVDLTNSPERTDLMQNINRLRKTLSDSLMCSGIFIISNGTVNWNGTSLFLPASVKIEARIIGLPQGYVSNSVFINYTAPAGGTNFALNNNEMIYIEISRNEIENSTGTINLTDGINDPSSSVVGRRIVKSSIDSYLSTSPQIKDYNNGTPEGTTYIPICARFNSNYIMWVLSGVRWNSGISSRIGQIFSETGVIPIGGIIAFHIPLAAPNGTQSGTVDNATINILAPGFVLCDGSVISDIESPLNGKNTLNLNSRFPRGSTRSNCISGSDSITLTESNLPLHNHGFSSPGDHNHRICANGNLIRDGDYGASDKTCGYAARRSSWIVGRGLTSMTVSTASEVHTHTTCSTRAQAFSGNFLQVASPPTPQSNIPQYYNVVFITRIK